MGASLNYSSDDGLYICPMRAALVLLIAAACLPFSSFGQTMSFGGGQLMVESGTTVTIQGDVEWQLAPDAVVVNDGVIDLDDSAVLSEAPGAAISGSGMERRLHTTSGPWSDINPGGLGLHLSNSASSGSITIHRGHVPFTAGGGDVSIARWYKIDALDNSDLPVQLLFSYDEGELNGLDESALVLHASPDPVGNWSDLIGSADVAGNTVSGAVQQVYAYFTAYEGDITGVDDEQADASPLRAWPTIAEDVVNVQCRGCDPRSRLVIVDARGRQVLDRTIGSWPVTIPVDHLSSGVFSLNVIGIGSLKIVRP